MEQTSSLDMTHDKKFKKQKSYVYIFPMQKSLKNFK